MTMPPEYDAESIDLCAAIDGHYRGRLFTPEQRETAKRRLDRASVHRGQLSAEAFREEWGTWPELGNPYGDNQ